MKPFPVHELIDLVRSLENLSTAQAVRPTEAIPFGFRTELIERTERMQKLCQDCGLTHTLDQFDRIKEKLGRGQYPITYAELASMLPEVTNRIEDETSHQVVMMVEPDYLKYFSDPQFFDYTDPTANKVSIQFFSANPDITEAGKCLACGRSTACVMHLNRIMEVGLKALAADVSVGPQNDWGKYLTEIESELTKRMKASGARSPNEQFYAEACAMFDSVRRAWRNPTMHVDKTYTEERAEEILIAVRSFMRHLATKLHD